MMYGADYDNDTSLWCDQHATPRTSCGCDHGPHRLNQRIVNGTWLDAQTWPDVNYFVPGIWAEGYTVFVGPPKAGKSWLILDTLLAVAAGQPALGHLPTSTPTPVLYFALEDGYRRLQKRARMLRPGQPIPGNLHVITETDPALSIKAHMEHYLETIPDLRIIVIDTLAKVMEPARTGETTYERDYRIGGTLKQICADHPDINLTVVHHNRKTTSGDFVDAVSGTNGVAGSADTIITLQRERFSDNGLLSVTGRDIEENQYAISMHGGCQWTLDGETLDQAALAAEQRRHNIKTSNLAPDQQRIVDYVNRAGAGVRPADVADHLGWDVGKTGLYMRRLVDGGYIDKLGARGMYGPRQ